ncbi:MAG: hypothetical protein IJH50_08215 [Kiritimatiellae bacterium]|nr:hypothetical protein [Kiritimatiellia bacterium]
MKSLTAYKSSMAMNIVFATCFASAAYGSANVFDDAVFWFRGGKDISGDHCMQQGEFFDDLHANDDSHNNHKMPMTGYTGSYVGFKENAEIQYEQVVFPALGANIVKEMQVLHISNAGKRSSGVTYYYPFTVNPHSIFENISTEYTIVSRIKMDEDGLKRDECLFKIGYNASAKQGMYLAVAPSPASSGVNDIGSRYIKGRCTPNDGGNDASFQFPIRIPTNTWVDLAVVVGNDKLRIGIATPESSANHGNNPTITFAETPMRTANGLSSGDHYRLFCYAGQSSPTNAANADQTCFIGSVQQLAIWGRALSDQDVMAAFGMPRPAIFRTGFDNGASTEFGGTRSGMTQAIDGLGSWQGISDTMLAGDEWTITFNALRDEAGLAQIFSFRSLPTSATAEIAVELNGTSLGTRRVMDNARVFWPVTNNLVTIGSNTLIIRRTDSGAGSFCMDAMELGGSLGVGRANHTINDGRVYPDRIATGVPSAADPNLAHWPVGLRPYSNNNTNLRFRVWVDPDVVGVYPSRFWTCVNRSPRSSGYEVTGSENFTIYVNGDAKTNYQGNASWEDIELKFDPGVLHGGWNDFEIRAAEAYENCHWLFDRYRFETALRRGFSLPPPGMTVILR